MQEKVVILGAGSAGIGAGYRFGKAAEIYEARERYGGLCDNFTVQGFRFDTAVHLSFAHEELVRTVFDKTPYYASSIEVEARVFLPACSYNAVYICENAPATPE